MEKTFITNTQIILLSLTVLSVLCCVVEVLHPNPTNRLGATILLIALSGVIVSTIVSAFWYRARIRIVKRQIQEKETLIQEMEGLKTAYKKSTSILLAQKVDDSQGIELKYWLHGLADPPWTNDARETEIEVKFVAPLLRHLGYKSDEVALRVPVPMQEGSKKIVGEADWVTKDENGDVLLVVEVKAPGKPLDEDAAKQARSYAFRLGAPVYIATNGNQLQIFQRGVLEDHCVVDWDTVRLAEAWEAVKEAAGKENVRALRESLVE